MISCCCKLKMQAKYDDGPNNLLLRLGFENWRAWRSPQYHWVALRIDGLSTHQSRRLRHTPWNDHNGKWLYWFLGSTQQLHYYRANYRWFWSFGLHSLSSPHSIATFANKGSFHPKGCKNLRLDKIFLLKMGIMRLTHWQQQHWRVKPGVVIFKATLCHPLQRFPKTICEAGKRGWPRHAPVTRWHHQALLVRLDHIEGFDSPQPAWKLIIKASLHALQLWQILDMIMFTQKKS